jgi:hypothetical protein
MEIVDENKSVRWPQCLAAFAGKNLRLKIFLEVLMKFHIFKLTSEHLLLGLYWDGQGILLGRYYKKKIEKWSL